MPEPNGTDERTNEQHLNITVRRLVSECCGAMLKVGSSDLRAYERVYNVDGDVTEVHISGQPTWRYDHDTEANIIRAAHHDKTRSFVVDQDTGRLDSAGEQSYVHDADGRVVQRGRESFEYTAAGALTRAFHVGQHDVTFHYDAWGRLIVRRDAIAGQSMTSAIYE